MHCLNHSDPKVLLNINPSWHDSEILFCFKTAMADECGPERRRPAVFLLRVEVRRAQLADTSSICIQNMSSPETNALGPSR